MSYKFIKYKRAVYRLAEPLYDEGFVGQRWGSQGAGLLLTTGEKVLLLLRSGEVEEPGTWGISGGAVRRDSDTGDFQDLKSAALQEAREEMGRVPQHRMSGQWVYQEGRFRYTTFVGTVDPSVVDQWTPTLNWESDDYGWFTQEELSGLDLHFGVVALLNARPNLVFYRDQHVDKADTIEYRGAQYRCVTAEFPAETYGAVVYHGSNEPDLDHIEGGFPPYEGGIGGGVYVDFNYDVAARYGHSVYQLKLKLKPEEIFVLEPESIPGLEGHWILAGEQVAPFWFEIDGDRYAVTDGLDFALPLNYWDDFVPKLKDLLLLPEKWSTYFPGVPHRKDLARLFWSAYTDLKRRGRAIEDWEEITEEDIPKELSRVVTDALWDALEAEGLDRAVLGDTIDEGFEKFADEHLTKRDYGLEINLDDIGAEVESHGYKAVYLEGIRELSELLVFNENDLQFVGLAGVK